MMSGQRFVGQTAILLSTLLLMLFFLPNRVQAQSAEWGGYLKFFAHPNLNKPYPFDRLGTRLQLTITNNFSQKAAFFASVDFNYEETQAEGTKNIRHMDVFPVEAYVDLFFSRLDLRLGKQFIFWGKTDWINPTDNINPWDYKNISAEIEDYRIPVTALKADAYLGNFDLEAVVVPHFLPHQIPMEMPDTMGIFPVQELEPRLPENKIDNAELGFRLQSALWNVDYSLSYYHGHDKFPSVRMTFDPIQHLFYQQTEYHPYHVFGGDFVTTFNKFALKGEAAYFLTADRDGKDIFVKNPHLQYVVGMDYLGINDLTLNLQFVQTILFRFDEAYERRQYQQLGMLLNMLPDAHTESLSSRIQYQLADFTTFQLITVLNLKDKDYFLLPILNYAFMDGLNIYAGATIFNGPEDSVFGKNKAYSRAFLEVKYSF